MKRIAIRLLFTAILTATFGVGCSGGSDMTNVDAGRVLSDLRKSYQSAPTLALKGKMNISGVPVDIWFEAYIKDRDSLKIVMNGPFGFPIGALSATRSHFVFYDAQNSEAIEGVPDRETFGELIQLQLGYDDMVALLRAEVPEWPAEGSYTTALRDDLLVYTPKSSQRASIDFAVDPSDLALVDYTRSRSLAGRTMQEIHAVYDNFTEIGDRRFPRLMTAELNNAAQKLKVTVERIDDSIDSDISCALNLPPGTSTRRL